MRDLPDLNNVGSNETTVASRESGKLISSQAASRKDSNLDSSKSSSNHEMKSSTLLPSTSGDKFREESSRSINSNDVAINGVTGCPSRRTLSMSLQQKRSSLTKPEFGFLQRLLTDGTEVHIESAIEKLNDDDLFFDGDFENENCKSEDNENQSNILNDAFINVSQDCVEVKPSFQEETSSIQETSLIVSDDKSKETKILSTPKVSNSSDQSDHTRVSSGNIETVIGTNGIVDLQKSTKKKMVGIHNTNNENMNNIISNAERTVSSRYRNMSKSLPLVSGHSCLSSVSSSARALTIAQRRDSSLHTDLWKAHSSGLAVTPIASNQTLAQTKAMRRASISNNIALRSIVKTRRLSFLSASELELLEQQKYDDDNPSNAKDRIPYQRQSSTNASKVFRSGVSRRGSLVENSSSRLRKASLLMKSERNISITSRTTSANTKYENDISVPPRLCVNSKYENKDITFPPPLCKANRLLSDSNDMHSSIPSIHIANHIGNEDSLSTITGNDNCRNSSTGNSIPKENLSITHDNSLRQESAVSQLSSCDSPEKNCRLHQSLHASTNSNAREQFKRISEKWLLNSVPSINNNDESVQKEENDQTVKEVDEAVECETPSRESEEKKRLMMMRQASVGAYGGIGVEIAEIGNSTVAEAMLNLTPLEKPNYRSFFRESSLCESVDDMMLPHNGLSLLDDTSSEVKRSLSTDSLFLLMNPEASTIKGNDGSIKEIENDGRDLSRSWDLESDTLGQPKSPDAWNVLTNKTSDSYGYTYIPFHILGTSADDVNSHPHVLSPPLMESLQSFLPGSLCEQNFWMRYSLLRDGDSMDQMLRNVRGAEHTILALETTGGEVFGSFTSSPWRKSHNAYGNGEAFLWRMRKSRSVLTNSIIDQAKLESEIDVYLWNGNNYQVQKCTSDLILVGGGGFENLRGNIGEQVSDSDNQENLEYGLGLAIDKSLMYGTSSFCATFDNPPLSVEHQDGSPFEILNLEIWSMTPETTLERAEDLECAKLFLESQLSCRS